MVTASIKDNLIAQIDKLPYDLQLRVLDFVKALSPKGVGGRGLLRFEGSISDDDLSKWACDIAICRKKLEKG
jgi:hypothetical protein